MPVNVQVRDLPGVAQHLLEPSRTEQWCWGRGAGNLGHISTSAQIVPQFSVHQKSPVGLLKKERGRAEQIPTHPLSTRVTGNLGSSLGPTSQWGINGLGWPEEGWASHR